MIIKKPEKGAWYYEIENPSFNFRITDIQCALGLRQLKKLDKFIKRRREIVNIYNRAFKNIKEIITPTEKDYIRSSWHLYPIQVREGNRRNVFEKLHKEGILVQVHYVPLHFQPFYQKQFGYKLGDFPITEEVSKSIITLPMYPGLKKEQLDYMINAIKELVKTL